MKALGNRLTPHKVKDITLAMPVFVSIMPDIEETQGMLISEEEGLEGSPMK